MGAKLPPWHSSCESKKQWRGTMANYKNQKRMDILNADLVEHKAGDPTEGYYPPFEYTYIDAAAK